MPVYQLNFGTQTVPMYISRKELSEAGANEVAPSDWNWGPLSYADYARRGGRPENFMLRTLLSCYLRDCHVNGVDPDAGKRLPKEYRGSRDWSRYMDSDEQ